MSEKTNGTVMDPGTANQKYHIFSGAPHQVLFQGKKELKFDRGVPRTVPGLYEGDVEKNLDYVSMTKEVALPWLKKLHEAKDFKEQMLIRLEILAAVKETRDEQRRDWVLAGEKKRDEKRARYKEANDGLVDIPELVEEEAREVINEIDAQLAIAGDQFDAKRRSEMARDIRLISMGSTIRTNHGLRRLKKILDEVTSSTKGAFGGKKTTPSKKGQEKKDPPNEEGTDKGGDA